MYKILVYQQSTDDCPCLGMSLTRDIFMQCFLYQLHTLTLVSNLPNCVRNSLNTIFFPGISVMDTKDYELTTNAFTRAKLEKKDNSKFAMTAGFKTFL